MISGFRPYLFSHDDFDDDDDDDAIYASLVSIATQLCA